MHLGHFLLLILGVTSGLYVVEGEELPSETPRTYAEAVSVLPPGEQHRFLATDPAWKKRVIVSSPTGEYVQTPSKGHKKPPARIFYSEKVSKTTWYPYIKTVYFYPNGKILSEIDDIPVPGDPISDDCFTRTFFPDGSIESYLHQRVSAQIWVAGIEVNPQTKKENHFFNGTGSLTSYHGTDSTTRWFHNNSVFLEVERDGSRRTGFGLYCSGNENSFAVAREQESLGQGGAFWTQKADGTTAWKVPAMHRPIDIDLLLLGAGSNEDAERRQILALWKNIYDNQRRPRFMKEYTELLKAAGQTWQGLGIEFIRDRTAWPDE